MILTEKIEKELNTAIIKIYRINWNQSLIVLQKYGQYVVSLIYCIDKNKNTKFTVLKINYLMQTLNLLTHIITYLIQWIWCFLFLSMQYIRLTTYCHIFVKQLMTDFNHIYYQRMVTIQLNIQHSFTMDTQKFTPSSHNPYISTKHKMLTFVTLHPLNTNKWNTISHCIKLDFPHTQHVFFSSISSHSSLSNSMSESSTYIWLGVGFGDATFFLLVTAGGWYSELMFIVLYLQDKNKTLCICIV